MRGLLMRVPIAAAILSAFLGGCTATTVRPVDPATRIEHVCIESNPKVIVGDFVQVLRDGLGRHGITTEVFSGDAPEPCKFILTYTARQSWDFVPYLSYAELRLATREGAEVGYAEYHLRGKGGFSPAKFAGSRTKIDPVIDELLQRLPPRA